MRTISILIVSATICTFLVRPSNAQDESAGTTASSAHEAHAAYQAAINSNDLDTLLDILTEDAVFMAPNDKPYVGKEAIRPWLEGYLAAYKTHWDKTVEEFVVVGEWAFERYSYKSTDTPLDGGAAIQDTGWGFLVYHHDGDGMWRVARDAWGQDHPAAM